MQTAVSCYKCDLATKCSENAGLCKYMHTYIRMYIYCIRTYIYAYEVAGLGIGNNV